MNVKSIFGTIGDTLNGLFGVLTGLVGVGIMSQVIFGTGWMGIDVVGNISNLVNTFLTCLLYTSPSPRDVEESRMPSSA